MDRRVSTLAGIHDHVLDPQLTGRRQSRQTHVVVQGHHRDPLTRISRERVQHLRERTIGGTTTINPGNDPRRVRRPVLEVAVVKTRTHLGDTPDHAVGPIDVHLADHEGLHRHDHVDPATPVLLGPLTQRLTGQLTRVAVVRPEEQSTRRMGDVDSDHREIRVVRPHLVAERTLDRRVDLELDHTIHLSQRERPSVLESRLTVQVVIRVQHLDVARLSNLHQVIQHLGHERDTSSQIPITNRDTRPVITLTHSRHISHSRRSSRGGLRSSSRGGLGSGGGGSGLRRFVVITPARGGYQR